LRADHTQLTGNCRTAIADALFLRHIVKMEPTAVSTGNDTLCAKHETARLGIKCFQYMLDLLSRELLCCFNTPGGEHLICMVVVVVMIMMVTTVTIMVIMFLVMVMMVAAMTFVVIVFLVMVMMVATMALMMIMILVMVMMVEAMTFVVIVFLVMVMMVAAMAIVVIMLLIVIMVVAAMALMVMMVIVSVMVRMRQLCQLLCQRSIPLPRPGRRTCRSHSGNCLTSVSRSPSTRATRVM